MTNRTVVFVCAHGAARSRIAAAWFNADAPAGRQATTGAGGKLSQMLNPRVMAQLSGTPAEHHLDRNPPRRLPATDPADLLIAVDCTVPGAHQWRLQAGEVVTAMREELHDRVAALIRTLHCECGITG